MIFLYVIEAFVWYTAVLLWVVEKFFTRPYVEYLESRIEKLK